jgi:hypothetical protein
VAAYRRTGSTQEERQHTGGQAADRGTGRRQEEKQRTRRTGRDRLSIERGTHRTGCQTRSRVRSKSSDP